MKGMEKQLYIHDNEITGNTGNYMVEFSTDSQCEALGHVYAFFEYNTVQRNRDKPKKRSSSKNNQIASTVVSVKGLQKINITHNLFGENEMDFELISGIYTSRLNNYLNVEANWWGSRDSAVIRERIFDFDDWNNYALADYQPFLVEGRLNAPVTANIGSKDEIDFDNLGGRLMEDLHLRRRDKPYTVTSDFTIMPGVTLKIDPGVVIEFYPSVGLLVLGNLQAIGKRYEKIHMRPVNKEMTTHYRVGRQVKHRKKIAVRLCVEGECEGRR